MPRRSHSYHIVKLKKIKEELEQYKEKKFYITSGDILTSKKDVINVVSYSDGTETDFSFGEKSEDEIYTLSINLVAKVVSLPSFVSVLKCEDVKKIIKIPDAITWVYFILDVPKLKKELPPSVCCLKYKRFDSPGFAKDQKLPRLLNFVTMSHVTSLYFKECTITNFVFPPALYEFNALESNIYFCGIFPKSVVRVSISMCVLINELSEEASFDDHSGKLSSEESSKEIGSELPEFEVGSQVATMIITGSKLTSLPKLKHLHRLHLLRVCENDLEDLPSLPKKLRVLDCSYNSLDELPRLPKKLKVLQCHVNNIWRFPKLPVELKSLKCSFNYLADFNFALPEGLVNLDIQSCHLTSLPRLPLSLETLRADYNRITRFQYLPPSLVEFDNSDNPNEFVEPLPINPYNGDFTSYEVGMIMHPILSDLRQEFGLGSCEAYETWYRIYWKIRGIIAAKRFIGAFQRSRKRRIDLHRRVCELIRLIPGGVDAKPSEVSQGLWVNP